MASPVQAQLMPLSNVLQLAQRCFDGDSPSSCQIVLDRAEQLQRSAAEREFYPCQTFLLGLQADVIMQHLGMVVLTVPRRNCRRLLAAVPDCENQGSVFWISTLVGRGISMPLAAKQSRIPLLTRARALKNPPTSV